MFFIVSKGNSFNCWFRSTECGKKVSQRNIPTNPSAKPKEQLRYPLYNSLMESQYFFCQRLLSQVCHRFCSSIFLCSGNSHVWKETVPALTNPYFAFAWFHSCQAIVFHQENALLLTSPILYHSTWFIQATHTHYTMHRFVWQCSHSHFSSTRSQ